MGDADGDGALPSFEFFEVIEGGKFNPTLRDLVILGVPQHITTTEVQTTTTLQRDNGFEAHKLIILLVGLSPLVVPFVCCLIGRQLVYKAGKPGEPKYTEGYKAVDAAAGRSDPDPRNTAVFNNNPRSKAVPMPGKRRSSPGLFSCCIRASDETEEQDYAEPLVEPVAGRAAQAAVRNSAPR